jgi:serine/threonine protein kinase
MQTAELVHEPQQQQHGDHLQQALHVPTSQQQQQQQDLLQQQQQQQQPAPWLDEFVRAQQNLQGVVFSAGQTFSMACSRCGSADGEQLLLQVERFICRGGSADVYQVKLLQRALPVGARQQVPVRPAAGIAALAAAAIAAATAAEAEALLQPGQHFAVKVARSLESYSAETQASTTLTWQLKKANEWMSAEWQVLQDMSTCDNIINAYRFGHVAAPPAPPAAAAAAEAPHLSTAVAAAAAGRIGAPQQLQGPVRSSAQAAAAAPLPCILMEYADRGSLRDIVYKQHGKPTPLGARRTWDVVCTAAWALRDLHAAGYIHRDLKMDNMLGVTRRGHPR